MLIRKGFSPPKHITFYFDKSMFGKIVLFDMAMWKMTTAVLCLYYVAVFELLHASAMLNAFRIV